MGILYTVCLGGRHLIFVRCSCGVPMWHWQHPEEKAGELQSGTADREVTDFQVKWVYGIWAPGIFEPKFPIDLNRLLQKIHYITV